MLATNLPILKQTLNKLIDKNDVVYEAAYNAYYEATKTDLPIANITDSDLSPTAIKKKSECEKILKDKAKLFATEFCKGLKDGGFMDTIADEVDKHIKMAQIDINVPSLMPTISSPVGPCSGSLNISVSTGAQIVIS